MAEIYGFDTKIRVEYVDTDKMGVVHNSNYFRFFERARCETMRAIGINYKDVEACLQCSKAGVYKSNKGG